MDYSEYRSSFDKIVKNKEGIAPYDDPEFLEYVRLNISRHDRWMKTGTVLPELEQQMYRIEEPLTWILITEPWCGDAAHVSPFIKKIAKFSDKVDLKIQLRDSDSDIEKYLTNGKRSIPILVVRDSKGKDLFHWGPRPKPATEIHENNLTSDKTPQQKKIELQLWYNNDKGVTFQKELMDHFRSIN